MSGAHLRGQAWKETLIAMELQMSARGAVERPEDGVSSVLGTVQVGSSSLNQQTLETYSTFQG